MYTTLIVKPLYNGLVGLMDVLPWIDVGIAVIIFTIIVKLLLFHLSQSSQITQIKMKEIEPEANAIRSQYANDKQAQALKVMELYKAKGIKPFSGVLLLFIQLPILLALLSVFYKIIPAIHPELLYSFVSVPVVKTSFLGFIDLTKKSLFLSVLAGAAQFIQLHFSLASKQFKPSNATKNASGVPPLDIAASMNSQMKYMMPVLAFVSLYYLIPSRFPQAASVVAIYWTVSAIFTLCQELYIRRKYAAGKYHSPVDTKVKIKA